MFRRFTRIYFCMPAMISVLLTASCNNPYFQNAPEEARLQSIIDSGYNISKPREALLFVENAYQAEDEKSIKDWYNYYAFKFSLTSRAHDKSGEAMIFADSMLLLIEGNGLEKELEAEYMQSLYAKGDVLFSARRYNSAFEYYFRAKKIGEVRLTPCELSDFNYRLGMVLYGQERYAEAAGYFTESYQQKSKCSDNYIKFYRLQELLSNTGLSYDRADIPDSALPYFRQALQLIDQQKNDSLRKELNDVARAVVYGNMASIYLKNKSYPQALHLLNQSLSINTQDGGDHYDACFTYLKLAHLYRETGDLAKMFHTLQLADKFLTGSPNSEARLDWHQQMAYYYERMGQIGLALQNTNRYVALQDSLRQELWLLRRTDMGQQVKMLEGQHQIAVLKEKNNSKDLLLYAAGVVLLMGVALMLLIYFNWKRSRKYIESLTSLNQKIKDQRNKLQHTLAQLEISHKEKDKILRVVAHDLRSPVTGIAALTDLLLLDTTLTGEQRDNLELIRYACEGSLTLSKEILEATVEMAPEKWEMGRADIKHLLSNQIELLRFRAMEKQQEIILHMPEHAVSISMNNDKISRAIDNIVINAIKFSPVNTRIDAVLEPVSDGIRISISDQGIGIPASIAERIFDMFTEAKRYGTTGETPYGLGLSISKQIIEAHGGKIWFENAPGSGTIFRIFLPN